MLPPVYLTLHTDTVAALVSDRIGRHGEVAQTETRDYIVWQVISDAPHDNLSDAPTSDFTSVQIDCYSRGDDAVEALASAVRNALDDARIVNRIIVNNRDPGTRLYRIGLQADFITQR